LIFEAGVEQLLTPAQLAAATGISAAVRMRLITLADAGLYYQIQTAGEAVSRYFNVINGSELDDGDRKYAIALARHYLGDHASEIRDTERVTQFGGEYDAINRLLPVYRVRFDRPDNMRAYVETTSSLPGTLVDDRKALLDGLFRNLHKWDWLNGQEPWRVVLALCLLIAALTTGLTGLIVFVTTNRGSQLPVVFWHRWLGLPVSVLLLGFAGSGGLHLVKMSLDDMTIPPRTINSLLLDEITTVPEDSLLAGSGKLRDVSLIRIDDAHYYRLDQFLTAAEPHDATIHHDQAAHSTGAGETSRITYIPADEVQAGPMNVSRHAVAAALGMSALPETAVTGTAVISRFDDEYGFVNKFLPVVRVDFDAPGRDAVYVHTASGRLAAHIDDNDRFEGWLFAYVHKWHFLDRLGMDLRDGLMATVALLIAAQGVLGLVNFVRRYRRAGTLPVAQPVSGSREAT